MAVALAWPAAPAGADEAWPPAIEDNSFLVEEAYNQEAGVVQWIFSHAYTQPGNQWVGTFTNEWPVPGLDHQLSYTIPYKLADDDGDVGLGDVLLNYRYQALAGGERGWWFAPRLSVLVPTGDWRDGLGNGAPGVQVGLPVSRRVVRQLVVHLNAGAQYVPDTRGRDPRTGTFDADTWAASGGASLVWLVAPPFNVMLEILGVHARQPAGEGRTTSDDVVLASPSFRYAVDTAKGQLVLGAGFPLGLTDDSPDWGALLYLSWEAPVWNGD